MRSAGLSGKGGGNDEQRDFIERAIELREANVVTNRQADLAARRVKRRRRVAGDDRLRLVVVLVSVLEAKQMNLVVARDAFARRAKDQQRLSRSGRIVACDRHAAADHVGMSGRGHSREKGLLRAVALALLRGELVLRPQSHEPEVLRQQKERRTLIGRFPRQPLRNSEVFLDVTARRHLNGRHALRVAHRFVGHALPC